MKKKNSNPVGALKRTGAYMSSSMGIIIFALVLAALSALAGLVLLVGIFAGFSWSLSMGVAALGFGMDSLFCALESMRTARG